MKYLLLLLLISCNNSDVQEAVTNGCSPDKGIFSSWKSRTDGKTYNLSGGVKHIAIKIGYNLDACNHSEGDLKIKIGDNNSIDMIHCNGVDLLDSGTYSESCGILTINYDDGDVEKFD